ncbi:uncharacterized protein LOC135690182 [Rhopilema esculentum]|uniref:uncharacterized protein LOC135690182 n=1 Tax=Rhopilema esculentum TaxID=499914 RepID=UPI0031D29B3B
MAGKFIISLLIAAIGLAHAGIENVIPPGHLEPFGSHMDPMPLEETENIPDAKTFFEKYVLPMRPIVFRNAAKKFPAYKLWTEEYLIEKYGDLEVRLENKLEKEGYTPSGAKGIGRDTVREFINTYKSAPKYIVSELPSPMYQDMMALPCMSCGPIKKRMVEIDLWMSSGSSQSILHKDAFHTMNCLINGTKDWKIVLYKYEKDVYKAYEEGNPGGGYSKINVRSVDMKKYPKISTLPYYNITVHGGDCLFLPKSTYHQVNSLPGFNLAVTILFSRFDFDRPTNFKDCNSTNEKFTPLNHFDIDWQYPGRGYMTMGYSELFGTKSSLFQDAKRRKLKVDDVLETFSSSEDLFTGERIDRNYVAKLFGIAPNDVITKAHVMKLKKAQLRKIGVAIQGVMASNSYDYEYYKISPRDIARLVAVLVKRDGALRKDSFVDWYVKKLYGTKLYGDKLFEHIAGKDSEQVPKETVLKSFSEATRSYVGDDGIEEYNPESKHNEKEDRGDAYIFVKKDLQGLEPDKDLLRSLEDLVSESQGDDGGEDEDTPESEEENAVKDMVEEDEEESPNEDEDDGKDEMEGDSRNEGDSEDEGDGKNEEDSDEESPVGEGDTEGDAAKRDGGKMGNAQKRDEL